MDLPDELVNSYAILALMKETSGLVTEQVVRFDNMNDILKSVDETLEVDWDKKGILKEQRKVEQGIEDLEILASQR